jgi:hypothetical protein
VDGRVAQLVEQCPFKAWVAGSNPAALTKNPFRVIGLHLPQNFLTRDSDPHLAHNSQTIAPEPPAFTQPKKLTRFLVSTLAPSTSCLVYSGKKNVGGESLHERGVRVASVREVLNRAPHKYSESEKFVRERAPPEGL